MFYSKNYGHLFKWAHYQCTSFIMRSLDADEVHANNISLVDTHCVYLVNINNFNWFYVCRFAKRTNQSILRYKWIARMRQRRDGERERDRESQFHRRNANITIRIDWIVLHIQLFFSLKRWMWLERWKKI